MEYTAVADFTAVINLDTGIDDCAVADGDIAADIGLGIYLRVIADTGAFADVGERTDIDVAADRGLVADIRGLLDACQDGLSSLRCEGHERRERGIRVVDADERGADGMLGHEIAAHQHDTRLGVVDMVGIFRICEKGDRAGTGFFDFGK